MSTFPASSANPPGPRRRTVTVNVLAKSSAALLLLVVLTGCGSVGDDQRDKSDTASDATSGSTVTTKLLSFEPETLTVKAGTTVTWKAGDGVGHTVTTGTFTVGGDGLRTQENPDGEIDKPLTRGKDVTFTFDEPGTYTYYCSIHKGMSGDVVVTP